MKEIFEIIVKILGLRIPIPISFTSGNMGYITVFGLFSLIIFFAIMSYIIYRIFK